MKKLTCLFGRLLLSSMFISSAINGLLHPFAMELAIGMYVPFGDDPMIGKIMRFTSIGLQLIAGRFVLIGFKTRLAAWILMIHLVAINVLIHLDFGDTHEMLHFGQNWSIVGGLLLLISFGAGPMSIDSRLEKLKLQKKSDKKQKEVPSKLTEKENVEDK